MSTIRLLTIVLTLACCYGQSVGISAPNNAKPGQTFQVIISKSGGGSIADIQAAIAFSGGVASVSGIVPGSAASAVSKSVDCGALGAQSITCIVWGLNQNIIGDGAVIVMNVTLAANASSGSMTISVASQLGSTAAGTAVALAANPPATVSVLSKCDINGDGQTNATDATAIRDQILGRALAVSDLNGDGFINVVDNRIIEIAVTGGACQ